MSLLILFEFAMINFSLAQPVAPGLNMRADFLNPEHSFQFTTNCNYWVHCETAKYSYLTRLALAEVGRMIGQELFLKEPVKVCFESQGFTEEVQNKVTTDSQISKYSY